MTNIVTFSEASLIAIHSMVLIARSGTTVNVQKIAEMTGSSRHHVAKVLQRLVKEGYLESNRGPSGGFRLTLAPEKVSLLNIYESIEGKVKITGCPQNKPVCPLTRCIFSNVVSEMIRLFRDHFTSTTLADMV